MRSGIAVRDKLEFCYQAWLFERFAYLRCKKGLIALILITNEHG